MNLDKLPKLSNTPPRADAIPETDVPRFGGHDHPSASLALRGSSIADTWIALVIGVIFLLMGGRFASWGMAEITGKPFHSGMIWTGGEKAGQEISYWEIANAAAFSDMTLFSTGIALLVAAGAWLVMGWQHIGPPAAVIAILSLTTAVVLNGMTVARIGQGALVSMLAIALLGYEIIMLIQTWRSRRA